MIRNANYVYDKIIVGNKDYCKKAQVGVDLTLKKVSVLQTPGFIRKDKTIVGDYVELVPEPIYYSGYECVGWYLPKGTYMIELNEGCKLGMNDTAYVIMRSSLNRNGVMIQSAVWDPGYECENMNLRLTVDTDGVYIEKNARVCQILVFDNEDTELYDGQFQGGGTHSKLQK